MHRCAQSGTMRPRNAAGLLAAALLPTLAAHASVEPDPVPFLRGDVNADERIDLSDALSVASYLFTHGDRPVCDKAADANDDGALDIADVSAILSSRFVARARLPAPYPGCGVDPTEDDLSCRIQTTCHDTITDDEAGVSPEPPPPPVASIELADGNRLDFIELAGSTGIRTVGISARVPVNAVPAMDALGLGASSPLEIFHALAEPDSLVPEVLIDLYGDRLDSDEPQGWGLPILESVEPQVPDGGGAADVACNNAWFNAYDEDYFPTYGRLSRRDQASNNSLWRSYCDYVIPAWSCSQCSNASRRRYRATVYNVADWRSHVCGRSTGNHRYVCPLGSSELRAAINFRYRDEHNNGWNTAASIPLPPNGGTYIYEWYWYGFLQHGGRWDWRTEIHRAIAGRDFWDIFMGWDH